MNALDQFTSLTDSLSSARWLAYIFYRLQTSCTYSGGSFLCTLSTDVQSLLGLDVLGRIRVTMRLGSTYIRLMP